VRVLAHLGALVLGALTALASIAVHRSGPFWLVLAVLASLGAVLVLRFTAWPRLASSYSLGWLVVFGLAVIGRPEGDYAIASDLAGYTLTVLAFGLVLLAVSALQGRRTPRP
jgi:hypothetical protein